MQNFIVENRYEISYLDATKLQNHLEDTEDVVILSKKLRAKRHTFRGVPAKKVDVRFQIDLVENKPIVIEILKRRGRYDGATRPSYTVRNWHKSLPVVSVLVDQCDANLTLTLIEKNVVVHSATYEKLRSDLSQYDLESIVVWHWRRYYQHLEWEEMRSIADAFSIEYPQLKNMTLAEANRLASRSLYQLSRQLGWKKLTKRDKDRFGLDASWVRADHPNILRKIDQPLIGQYTQDASCGRIPIKPIDDDDEIKTSYGVRYVE